ncbi:MAG: hypothetical protein R3F21_25560 [Myxococcota bacterium]
MTEILRRSFWSAVAGLVWMLGAGPAGADECNPLATPATLAAVLETGSGSIPGLASGVPFSVFSLNSMTLSKSTCTGSICGSINPTGVAECGDLASNPLHALYTTAYPLLVSPELVSDVSARQVENGRWAIAAQSFNFANDEIGSGSASYSFILGTREFIDVGSTGGTERLPLDIGLRVGAAFSAVFCDGNLFHWSPLRDFRFRVRETPASGPGRTLVSTVFYDAFGIVDDVFSVEVTPGAVLTVDVYLRVVGNATPGQDIFGEYCASGDALLDMHPALVFFDQAGSDPLYDGIQVQFSPDPALVLTPRSGLEYETVPEPHGFAGAALASMLLGVWKRRRDREASARLRRRPGRTARRSGRTSTHGSSTDFHRFA